MFSRETLMLDFGPGKSQPGLHGGPLPHPYRGAKAVHVYVTILSELLGKFRRERCMVGRREVTQSVSQCQLEEYKDNLLCVSENRSMSDICNSFPYLGGRALLASLLQLLTEGIALSLGNHFWSFENNQSWV